MGNSMTRATYFANYEDHDGFDEVPCLVDLDNMEVVEFYPAISCRWDSGVMCISETIQLDDGSEFCAVKYDEYNDAADEFDRSSVILFDNDMLEAACTEGE